MQRQSGDLSPFQERVNVNLFFSGAGRRKLLDDIYEDLAGNVSMIAISGEEGCGKTMICRMVQKELPADFSCVYLPNTMESFEDVVRVLALGLGTDNSEQPGNTVDLVSEIATFLRKNERHLVAIFDQTERMYLATLERIRKMLDQLNEKEVIFHMILAGRKSLMDNIAQLEICEFMEIEEKRYILDPLGLSETYGYLNHCVQQRPSGPGKNVFTPEVAKKIFGMAKGNFRMTNMLAEKTLESSDSETSFMVLLDNVSETRDMPLMSEPAGRFGKGFSRLLGVAGGVGVLVIMLLLISGDKEPPRSAHKDSDKVVVAERQQTEGKAEKKGQFNKEQGVRKGEKAPVGVKKTRTQGPKASIKVTLTPSADGGDRTSKNRQDKTEKQTATGDTGKDGEKVSEPPRQQAVKVEESSIKKSTVIGQELSGVSPTPGENLIDKESSSLGEAGEKVAATGDVGKSPSNQEKIKA